jgi:hypothetical protein
MPSIPKEIQECLDDLATTPRTRMKKTGYSSLDFHESPEAFTKQRAELVTRLRALNPVDWARGNVYGDDARTTCDGAELCRADCESRERAL